MTFKIIHTNREPGDGAGRGVLEGRGRFAVALALLAGVGVVARLLALPAMLPDLDSVNFARALTRFDLGAQAPHFPGYPVYVVLARLSAALGAPEVLALSLPGVVLAAVATGALGLLLRRSLGSGGALAGAALVALLPLPVLAGGSPSSDGAGVAALALVVAAVLAVRPEGSRWWAVLAGALAGLALGVRPSYVPAVLGLALVLPRGQRGAGLAGGVLGVGAWGLPLVAVTGVAGLWRIGSSFVAGHAGEWGGTVAVQPDLALRLELLGFDVLAAGLGLPWSGAFSLSRGVLALVLAVPLVALAVAALGRALAGGERRVALVALALGLPYGAWMFVGQNLLKARHALPVVLAVALLAAAGVAVLARALAVRPSTHVWLTGALAVALAAVTLPLALAQGREPSPAGQLVRHVRRTLPAAGTLLFTGEEARLFEHYAPQYRAGRPATGAQLRREVERLAAAGADVYVTSAAPGASELGPHLVPVIRFSCERLVRSHANDIVLYHYRPGPPASSEKVL